MPRFERFLLAPSISELKKLADRGPIVVFNVSNIRSDAILIDQHDIRSIQLPLLTYDDLVAYSNQFIHAIQANIDSYRRAKVELKNVLEWLWDVAVNPILAELGFLTPLPTQIWPRVWWVASGLLNLLPIHAAGYHDISPPQAAIDHVISSYTPTIKALKFAMERLRRGPEVIIQKAILVGMPQTPEYGDLSFAAQEIEELQQLLSGHIETTVVEQPTKERVLSILSQHQILHLSCHGTISEADPSPE